MATLHAFDTLAYTKALVDRGYERDKAEALAEAQREFFVKELASEELVKAEFEKVNASIDRVNDKIDASIDKVNDRITTEIDKVNDKIDRVDASLRLEMALMENRLNKNNAKMLAFAVGVLLAGIPIMQAIIQKLG